MSDCPCSHPASDHEPIYDSRFDAWYDDCERCACCFLSASQGA